MTIIGTMDRRGRSIVASLGLIASFGLGQNVLAESQIRIQREGNEVAVAWSGGVLQSAPNSTGPWTLVAGAINPYKPNLTRQAYYRVQETYAVTITKAGTGTGQVNSLGPGITCGSDCGEEVLSGQVITLHAIADEGSTFAGWTGDCTGNGDCQLSMSAGKTALATFTKVTSSNPVVNGDFEEGAKGWSQQPGQLIVAAADLGVAANSGQFVARLGYAQDNRRVVKIGQQVTLPQTTPLFLNFATWIYSEELCDVPYYDGIAIYVNGQAVVNDERVCRSNNTDGWRRYSIDLTAAAGQTITFVFELSSVDFLSTIVLLDDIAVSNQSWQ